MANFTIQGGTRFETATPDEVRGIFREEQARQAAHETEKARGLKYFRTGTRLLIPAGTRFTDADAISPDSNMVWSVMILAAQLAAAGTFEAWATTDTSSASTAANLTRLVANGTTSSAYQVFTYARGALVLQPGEGFFLSATQNIVSYYVAGWQVPAEMEYKLI